MKRWTKAANANFQCLITEFFIQIQSNQREKLSQILESISSRGKKGGSRIKNSNYCLLQGSSNFRELPDGDWNLPKCSNMIENLAAHRLEGKLTSRTSEPRTVIHHEIWFFFKFYISTPPLFARGKYTIKTWCRICDCLEFFPDI